MRKKLISLFSLLLCLTLLAGCGTPAPAVDNGTEADTEEGTLPSSAATTEAITETTTEETPNQKDPEVTSLNGKKIIFIGNSYTYYGKTVLEKKQTILTQAERSNDHGFFYQLCNENGANVSVTNWTFGAHSFVDLFENCTADRGCNGVDHASYLTDRNFDYVIMQYGSSIGTNFIEKVESVMKLFKEVNPNVKFVFLVQTAVHNNNYAWKPLIKQLENMGVTVVDWGSLVCDIINGAVAVPGAKEIYNKNSFIVCKSASDGYHPNMLTGYITTLMTYCAITGESAVGQTYAFCNDSKINSAFSFSTFISKYYTYNNATTNFPAVFQSESDMKGIQQLIDQYLEAKAYRNY